MKKLFLLIPLFVFSLLANAATININTGTTDALRKALASAANGDEIVMAAGTYVESNSDYIAFTGKSVTVRAATGANVILQPQVPIIISEGGKAILKNIKIDASRLTELADWYSHLMYASDNADNNRLILDGCEVYGYAEGKAVIACRSSYKLDSLIINNCKFYNHTTRSCVFLENTANKGLIVRNSTFNNITTGTADFSAGVVDSRSASGKVQVDHCTFYNCYAKNTDYGAIKVPTTTDSHVSNCIFMMSESYSGGRAVYNTGGTVDNCLTYNYTKDSAPCHGIHSGPTITNCFEGDPLFSNAASGNFTIANNWTTMSLSPACCAATDGSDLGDPRWSNPTLPSTNLASPYQFTGNKAKLNGNIWYDGENNCLYGDGGHNKVYGTATWKVHIEKACVVGVALNLNAGNTSGHKIRIEIKDADGNSVGEFAEQTSTLPGTFSIPAEGDYTIILHDDQEWSSAKIDNVTLTYIGGDIQAMPGTTDINDAWFSANGTRADGKISFPGSTIQEGWVKWNVAFANTGNYNVTLNVNSNNCKNYTVALVDANDDDVVTPLTLSDCSTTGTLVALAMGAMEVPAGNYILKVTNATQHSDAELISVNFAYTGGGIIDIPGSIALNEAILSERAFVDGDGLHFVDADHSWLMSEGYAKWNIHVAADGMYKFTANCNTYETSFSNLTIKVLQGGEEKYSFTPEYTYTGEKAINSPEWFLEAGNYELKLSNPANHSNGYLVSLSAAAVEGILVVDELATDMAYIDEKNGQSMKPLLKRSFRSGMFNTVCFPFNGVTAGELESIFGAGYELLEMSSATLADNVLTLNFSPVSLSSDTYGRPYLIKPTKDVVNPLFNSHTIYKSTSHLVANGDNANFVGSFIKGTIPAGEDNLFLGANDLLYFSEAATTIKGMRAYFQIHDVPSGAPIRQARIVEQGNVVTALEFINGEWQEIKSANGTIKTIENGQLILIRDGKRYNVMGVRF